VLWRQSVLPLASRITCALTHWLAPVFGEGLVLAADIDRIEALSADRAALWDRANKAQFLSVNETARCRLRRHRRRRRVPSASGRQRRWQTCPGRSENKEEGSALTVARLNSSHSLQTLKGREKKRGPLAHLTVRTFGGKGARGSALGHKASAPIRQRFRPRVKIFRADVSASGQTSQIVWHKLKFGDNQVNVQCVKRPRLILIS
jgi:hypothetical protein